MSTMVAELYDALISAGAPEEKARAAAKAIADYDGRFSGIDLRLERLEAGQRLTQWMVGTNAAITIAVLLRLLVH